METVVAHMDLDAFFVGVERLNNQALVDKPVIIGGMGDRGVVSASSYEARTFGVYSAMPMKLARQLCPQAIYIKGDYDAYSMYSNRVTDLLVQEAPVVEKASIDEFYLDLSGMDRYFGTLKFATELRQKVIKETGLALSMGLSVNKTVSKVATNEAKPCGQLEVSRGTERSFLAPLPVSRMPGIGEVTSQKLRNMGIVTLGTLAEMPKALLVKTFGKAGISMWERANGIDVSPVMPAYDQKSFSQETTFQTDTTDMDLLRRVLIGMVEELTQKIRQEQSSTGCVSVKLRYSNFDTYVKQTMLTPTTADNILIDEVLDLFEKLYDRRLLIRLIGVKFSKLVHGLEQLDLFNSSARILPLYHIMDGLRRRFGDRIVGRAVSYSFKPKPEKNRAI